MRAYFWGNMYLSSIQQGIQSAHCLAEIYEKYREVPGSMETVANSIRQWARLHKTMILLNGGYGDNLRELITRFDNKSNPYPWASFYEGQDSLDGALTCVGIILPGVIYNGAAAIRKTSIADVVAGDLDPVLLPEGLKPDFWRRLTAFEQDLCLELNKYGLAS